MSSCRSLPRSAAATDTTIERAVVTKTEVAVGRAVVSANDEAVSAYAIAVGRAARGKRAFFHGEAVAVRNKQRKTSAPVNVTMSTQTTDPFTTLQQRMKLGLKKCRYVGYVVGLPVIGWSIPQNCSRKLMKRFPKTMMETGLMQQHMK
jgi:hypothetical protein